MSLTRSLLLCGIVAGPAYVIVAAAQVVGRDGFDITRHPVSLLSNGDLGWIQILNFVITGILVIAAALGLRSVSSPGWSTTWVSRLLVVYGAGLIGSGIFVADPSHGFPPGTPAGDPATVTFSGVMHFMTGGIAFLALIAACLLFARKAATSGQTGWAWLSAITGVTFLVAFALTAVFAGEAFANLLLTFAVILGWVWISALSVRALGVISGERESTVAFS